jgi:NDP-sugar pyrophosphorylase family protein
MKALLLIGGLGTRLRPVTDTLPKQLIPIAGKPILYHTLDLLPRDLEEVVLSTGYKADQVAAYVRDHPTGLPIRTVPESTPLGSGGAMRFAGQGMSDPFFLLNTDVVTQVSLGNLLRAHERHGGMGTMALAAVSETQWYGVAELQADRIVRFVEKPPPGQAPSKWINAGVAVWGAEVLDHIPPNRPLSFEQEIVPTILDRGLYGFRLEGYWEDAGTPDRVLHAQRLLFDGGRAVHPRLPEGAQGSPLVCSAPSARVDGAQLGPYVTVEDEATIGPGARVSNSIVMAGAKIGREATVIGSILGPGSVVADGVRVADRMIGAGARA